MIDRRRLLIVASVKMLSDLVLRADAVRAQPLGRDPFLEEQRGDVDLDYEQVMIYPRGVDLLVAPLVAGGTAFAPWRRDFAAQFVATAKTLVGSSRTRTPSRIAEFFALFDLPADDRDPAYTAYAAAGLSYAAAMAYCDLLKKSYNDDNRLNVLRAMLPSLNHWYFYPTPSCWDLYREAAGTRRWEENTRSRSSTPLIPHPGWIVVYDFGRGADHCGIVESAAETTLRTIEFNTRPDADDKPAASGAVASRTRSYEYVKGFVVTTEPPDTL